MEVPSTCIVLPVVIPMAEISFEEMVSKVVSPIDELPLKLNLAIQYSEVPFVIICPVVAMETRFEEKPAVLSVLVTVPFSVP